MNATHTPAATLFKVGIFTFFGVFLFSILTIYVNENPFFWKPCQYVKVNIKDATGLKKKSPIRSLGIEIGYLKSVFLEETYVTLGICITLPVQLLPDTRAYVRGEGFLGDKFVELKPVQHLRGKTTLSPSPKPTHSWNQFMYSLFFSTAWAGDTSSTGNTTEIPVSSDGHDMQTLMNRVDDLVHQVSDLTTHLKDSVSPEELQSTVKALNKVLSSVSTTLSPQSGMTQIAQRTLAKLEDAIEQLRSMVTRVNKGEGSIGMIINDPSYAEELHLAIRNINRLLNRVAEVRFIVDVGTVTLTGYKGARGWFNLGIWPRADRYYLLGVGSDSRGRISLAHVTTTAGGVTQLTQTQTVEPTSLFLTGMLGKTFFENRLDLSVGILYGDGSASLLFKLGPSSSLDLISIRGDFYSRPVDTGLDGRFSLIVRPFSNVYLRAGLESVHNYPGTQLPPFLAGASIAFNDEDIKLLFALK